MSTETMAKVWPVCLASISSRKLPVQTERKLAASAYWRERKVCRGPGEGHQRKYTRSLYRPSLDRHLPEYGTGAP
jgi:hypothetical protein